MRFISERVKYPFFFIPAPLTFVVNSTMTSLPPPPPVPLKNILQSFGILNYSLLPRWLICLVDSPSDTNQFEFCPRFFNAICFCYLLVFCAGVIVGYSEIDSLVSLSKFSYFF